MPAKKTTTKTKSTTKRVVTKPATKQRKIAPKKSRSTKSAPVRSFKLHKETKPFMTTQLSKDSLYWTILGIVVIAFTLWIMQLQSNIQAIYDKIEMTNADSVLLDEAPVKHKSDKKKD